MQYQCPFGDRHKNNDASWSGLAWIGDRQELVVRCQGCGAGWKELQEHMGLPASAFWPNALPQRPRMINVTKSKVVAEYHYHDPEGKLLAIKYRWEPGFLHGRKKDFTWRRPAPDAIRTLFEVPADTFAWVQGLHGGEFAAEIHRDGTFYFKTEGVGQKTQIEGVEVGIYRVEQLVKADPKQPVFVVEGEGKADLLCDLRFVATSGPAGKSKWNSDWGKHFAGRRVVVVPDRDLPHDGGLEWADKVVASAIRHKCLSVRVVMIPTIDLPPAGGDIKDLLLRVEPKQAREYMIQLVQGFPEYRTELAARPVERTK